MSDDSAQLIYTCVEYFLLFTGAAVVICLLASPTLRRRWLAANLLPAAPWNGIEFVLLVCLVLLCGFTAQFVLQSLVAARIDRTAQPEVLGLIVYGFANYLGGAIGWLVFFRARGLVNFEAAPAAPPVPRADPAPCPPSRVPGYALLVFLVSLPVLDLLSLGWNFLLEKLGQTVDPQPLLALFSRAHSPVLIAGLVLVACVLAPVYEELLFRAGLYRVIRQRWGRAPGLLISGVGFGLLHGHLASFLPLAVLGMIFAVAYEATGAIAVPIVAHGLFNLHTVALLLAGFTDLSP